MNLEKIRDALLTVGVPVFHYIAQNQDSKYIVWSEDGEAGSGHADNKKTTQVIQGSIDYFTQDEFDVNIETIQNQLNSINIAWRLNSVQYEDDTGYIHYEWIWEMV